MVLCCHYRRYHLPVDQPILYISKMNNYKGLKAMGIIHKAMLAGLVLFAAISIYMISSKTYLPSTGEDMDRVFQVIAIIFSATGFFAGTTVFKKKTLQARNIQGVQEKFSLYRSACILQWALLEGPCIFSLAAFFLTGNYAFIGLSGVLIILFGLLAPSKAKILVQLGLDEQELADL